MLNRLLPRQVDNNYRGPKVALWLFALLVLVKVIMSVNSIFNAESIARSADGIPLGTFPPAAAQTVVSLFALTAFSRLMSSVLGILVLVRYRAMVPLMFALFLLEHLGRRLVLQFLPIPRTGTSPGSAINLVLLAVMIVGLALSLWNADRQRARE
jgi:hypothetical protein